MTSGNLVQLIFRLRAETYNPKALEFANCLTDLLEMEHKQEQEASQKLLAAARLSGEEAGDRALKDLYVAFNLRQSNHSDFVFLFGRLAIAVKEYAQSHGQSVI